MDYTIRLHLDYVEAITSGDVDLADGKACVDETLRLCLDHGLSKVLVNGIGLASNVSVASRFGVGEYIAAHASPRMRVAILTSSELGRESKALQNTANNRGAQVITTDAMEEALAFLGVSEE